MAAKFIRRARFIGDDRAQATLVTDGSTNVSAIEVGDFVFFDGVASVVTFSDLSDAGTKAQNQRRAAAGFCGIALNRVAAVTVGNVVVATKGVFEVTSSSATYVPGQLVGPAGTGTAGAVGVSSTTVAGVTAADLAIGTVNQGGSALTTLKVSFSAVTVANQGGFGALSGTSILSSGSILSTGADDGIGYGTGAGGAVTQLTNSATGVTIDTPCGQITTVALTTAAAAEEVFTVTCASVIATDVIAVSTTYAGAGTALIGVKKVAAGAFDITITNLHAANALNAVVVINFVVIKSVAA